MVEKEMAKRSGEKILRRTVGKFTVDVGVIRAPGTTDRGGERLPGELLDRGGVRVSWRF